VQVADTDIAALREAILAPKYNFGAPTVAAAAVRVDGTLELLHDHKTDGRGLDSERAHRVLEYLQRVWRRPVRLHTVNESGGDLELHCTAGAA
jgi:stage V sporulation protein R